MNTKPTSTPIIVHRTTAKVREVGGSSVISLDKGMLAAIGVKNGDQVTISFVPDQSKTQLTIERFSSPLSELSDRIVQGNYPRITHQD